MNYPEQYRKDGDKLSLGVFLVPHKRIQRTWFFVIASDGAHWDHVSVSLRKYARNPVSSHQMERTPTWEEMCWIKDLFWDKEQAVIQFHPPESEYVSIHDYVLHLWRPQQHEVITPPPELVGIITGQKN